jgi:hypothetical protein
MAFTRIAHDCAVVARFTILQSSAEAQRAAPFATITPQQNARLVSVILRSRVSRTSRAIEGVIHRYFLWQRQLSWGAPSFAKPDQAGRNILKRHGHVAPKGLIETVWQSTPLACADGDATMQTWR